MKINNRKGQQGATEFAFVCIFFFGLICVLTDMVQTCYTWASLQYAVNEAARQNSLGKTNAMALGRNLASQMGLQYIYIELRDADDNLVSSYNASTNTQTTTAGELATSDPSTYVFLKAYCKIRLTPISDVVYNLMGHSLRSKFVYAGTIIKNEPFN